MKHHGNDATALKLHVNDNVAVALRDLPSGATIAIGDKTLRLKSDVPIKHKFAIDELQLSSDVVMYGVTVGRAKKLIVSPEALTTDNLDHSVSEYRDSSNRYQWYAPDASRWREMSFAAYRRSDGQVGTRNYWLVVPLVFCENRNVRVLQQAFEEELGYAIPSTYRQYVAELAQLVQSRRPEQIREFQFSESVEPFAARRVFRNLDGIKFLAHEGGCGGTREDAQALCGLIAGYIHHPNVAGATVLSLGCQNAQIEMLREELQRRNSNFAKPVLIFDQQQSGLESKMLKGAIRATMLALRGGRQPPTRASTAVAFTDRPEMWRVGWLLRNFCELGAGSPCRPDCRIGRYRDFVGVPGVVWR